VTIDLEDPLAVAVVEAIRAGDQEGLRRLLDAHPGLATAGIDGVPEAPEVEFGGTTQGAAFASSTCWASLPRRMSW
jgi:hypothetical protein